MSGWFTVWAASSAEPSTELAEVTLYITVLPTRTSVLLTLEEMVKKVIADLNAQLADPSRAGVENVKAELRAIPLFKHHSKEVVDLFPVVDICEVPCVSICTEKPQGVSGIRLGRNIVPTPSRDAQFVVRSLDSIVSRVAQTTMLPAVNGKWSAAIAINARSSDDTFSITSMSITVSRPHPKQMWCGSLPALVVDG